jgi:hypothetical protein
VGNKSNGTHEYFAFVQSAKVTHSASALHRAATRGDTKPSSQILQSGARWTWTGPAWRRRRTPPTPRLRPTEAAAGSVSPFPPSPRPPPPFPSPSLLRSAIFRRFRIRAYDIFYFCTQNCCYRMYSQTLLQDVSIELSSK